MDAWQSEHREEQREKRQAHYATTRDEQCRKRRDDRLANIEAVRAKERASYHANHEHNLEVRRRWASKHRAEHAAKQREYYAANRDRCRADMKRYAEEHREQLSAYHAEYRDQNRESIREENRRQYAAKAEERRAYANRYRENHPDWKRASNNRRKALQRNAPINDFTAEQWTAMKAAYGHRCAYCGVQPEKLTMDHIVPLARRGSHTESNIVPACLPCNMRKKTGPAPARIITPLPQTEAA